jgi:actin-related protein
MFETFNVPAFFLETDSVCSLAASGLLEGLSVDFGSIVNIVPIYGLHALKSQSQTINTSGEDVTDFLMKLLAVNGHRFTTTAERRIVRDIKEKLCFVSEDYGNESNSSSIHTTYELPDGNILNLGSERITAPEIYFQPDLNEMDETPEIQDVIVDVVQNLEISLRSFMMENIVLSGGSCFEGMDKRLLKELESRYENKFKVISPPERKYSAWIGASILSSMMDKNCYIQNGEYEEIGPKIVNIKCF